MAPRFEVLPATCGVSDLGPTVLGCHRCTHNRRRKHDEVLIPIHVCRRMAFKPGKSLGGNLAALLELGERLAGLNVVVQAETAKRDAHTAHRCLDVRRDQHIVADVGVGIGEEGKAGVSVGISVTLRTTDMFMVSHRQTRGRHLFTYVLGVY